MEKEGWMAAGPQLIAVGMFRRPRQLSTCVRRLDVRWQGAWTYYLDLITACLSLTGGYHVGLDKAWLY